MRTDAPARRQGVDRPGLGLGSRAGARDGGRHGHARRRLSRRRVRGAADRTTCYETTKLLNSPKGVLHIINNYTGDRMAFDMGREMAEAEGIKIGTVIVDDDVAVKDSTYTVGRRGVAGNFFVIKALGAASEQGADLDDARRARRARQLRHAHDGHGAHVVHAARQGLAAVRPRRRRDGDGRRHPRRAGPPPREARRRANAIIDELLEAVVTDLPFESGDEVALMVNGLGGTPIRELYLLYGRAHEQLAEPRHQRGRATTSASTAPRSTWRARR